MDDRQVRIKRYKEIIAVFTRHGFGMLFQQADSHPFLVKKRGVSDQDVASDNVEASAGWCCEGIEKTPGFGTAVFVFGGPNFDRKRVSRQPGAYLSGI